MTGYFRHLFSDWGSELLTISWVIESCLIQKSCSLDASIIKIKITQTVPKLTTSAASGYRLIFFLILTTFVHQYTDNSSCTKHMWDAVLFNTDEI